MYPGIELRLLRYVVAVAEELSFVRAARRLHVSQPTLSKQIIELEGELETRLFDRTKRDVSLTEAGALFVEQGRKALQHSEEAAKVVRFVRPSTHLQIGYSPYVNPDLIASVRSLSGTTSPKFTVSLKSYFTRKQISKLHEGRIDAALVILPVSDSDLVIEPVITESLYIALPDGHTLLRHRSIALADLQDLPVISFPQNLHPEVFQQLSDSCNRAGLKPNIAHEVTTFPEALSLVAQGAGYTFIRKCFTPFLCPGVVLRPIKGSPLLLTTGVAYSRRRKTSQLDAFLFSLKRLGTSLAVDGRSLAA
jgi:DNA-binding transcriptional LysR family regulator